VAIIPYNTTKLIPTILLNLNVNLHRVMRQLTMGMSKSQSPPLTCLCLGSKIRALFGPAQFHWAARKIFSRLFFTKPKPRIGSISSRLDPHPRRFIPLAQPHRRASALHHRRHRNPHPSRHRCFTVPVLDPTDLEKPAVRGFYLMDGFVSALRAETNPSIK
jgi:hypothetical protein